jgi:1-acyl-sn-glycerol-3-phosphate acyltransferase
MAQARELPPISDLTLRLFRRVVRSYFRRHFRAVSVQRAEVLAQASGPLVVYANHSSWWDPMVSVLLAEKLQAGARHYAPMDAAALAKYPILRRLGIFPIDMATARGAAQFLRTSQGILDSGGVLWITPQGRFADAREALVFKPGLGALAARNPGLRFVPLAIEYTFWDERLPETLLRFGEPVALAAGVSSEEATALLVTALSRTMDDLRSAAIARDPRVFTPLLSGGRGTGGLYALGRRVRALFTGTPVVLDHTQRDEPPAPTAER